MVKLPFTPAMDDAWKKAHEMASVTGKEYMGVPQVMLGILYSERTAHWVEYMRERGIDVDALKDVFWQESPDFRHLFDLAESADGREKLTTFEASTIGPLAAESLVSRIDCHPG